MISVSELAPALAILKVIIFKYLQRVPFRKRVLFMLVTYITKLYRSFLEALCCLVLHVCEAMKQDSIPVLPTSQETDTCQLISWKSFPAMLVL